MSQRDKRDTTPHIYIYNLYVLQTFVPTSLIFPLIFYSRGYIERTINGRKNARIPVICREILRLEASRNDPFWRNRDFPNADSYCFYIPRYRAGDESLFLLSIRANERKQRADQETKFQFWRVCACSPPMYVRVAIRDARPRVRYRVHRLYPPPPSR